MNNTLRRHCSSFSFQIGLGVLRSLNLKCCGPCSLQVPCFPYYVACPAHLIILDFTILGLKIKNLPILQRFSAVSPILSRNISLHNLVVNVINSVIPIEWDIVLHLHITEYKNIDRLIDWLLYNRKISCFELNGRRFCCYWICKSKHQQVEKMNIG